MSGLPAVGETLTASTSNWLGNGLSFSYQWSRCDETGSPCSAIAGATSDSYVVTAADRRSAIIVAVTAAKADVSSTASSSPSDPVAASVNPVLVENAQPGTSQWWPGNYLINDARAQAYTSSSSVAPGEALQVHVSTTPSQSYRLEIYRLGWYGGTGGRLVACLPGCGASERGAAQPTAAPDPSTGELDAGWPVTDQTIIGQSWVSGYYEIKVVLTTGPYAGFASVVPFIVKSPAANPPSSLIVQAGTNTWQAYNNWGGKSLYSYNSSDQQQAYKVSFSRPDAYAGTGNGAYTWDVNLVRFLERNGFDVSYVADSDVDTAPSLLLGHRVAITAGHDEYWTSAIRDGWEAARNAGVDLWFAGANTGIWQARYEDNQRTLVEYRSAALDPDADPTQKTVEFRALADPRPECQLEGEQYAGGLEQSNSSPIPYMLDPTAASDPFVSGTGLQAGQPLPDLVGYEYDSISPGCNVPGTLHRIFTDGGTPQAADATYYYAPSGSLVFASGSIQYSWALDDWRHPGHAQPGVQRLMGNILDADLGYPPPHR